jgi:SAM-dependent methyltransferase
VDAALEYWRSGQGLGNITPGGMEWPEGPYFASTLSGFLYEGGVVEVGCGTGRLATCFPSDAYIGLDLCPQVVAMARERCPRHDFRVIAWDDPLPEGDTALFHTVLLHIPDELLPTLLAKLGGFRRVVVGEILGRKWRRPGNPPVFNRELEEYREAFAAAGFLYRSAMLFTYSRYPDTHLSLMDFRRSEGQD